LGGEIDEGAFFSAQRDGNFDAVSGVLGEQGRESFAVFEFGGNENSARNVTLVDVELLEERAEDPQGLKPRLIHHG
jgi:hypothetical protein